MKKTTAFLIYITFLPICMLCLTGCSGQTDKSAIKQTDFQIADVVYFNPYAGTVCNEKEAWTLRNPQSQCFTWYIIKNSSDTVDMILDHNLGSRVPWISLEDFISAGGTAEEYGLKGNNKYGPVTALKELKNVTDSFQNVQTLTKADSVTRQISAADTYTIDYTGYKARMAGGQELADLVNNKPMVNGYDWNPATGSYIHAMPVWLYANLGMPGQAEALHVAWYTDTAHTARPDTVWVICLGSNLGKGSVSAVGRVGAEILGVRPIVRVKKNLLQ